jgi:uncharacterized protein VirK/YbjX
MGMELPGSLGSLAPARGAVQPAHPRLSRPARLARALLTVAVGAKKALAQRLLHAFPLGYEILFSPGNFDEPLLPAIGAHRKLKRLLNQPSLRALLAENPEVVYRPYLRYLATSFTKTDRRAALYHHYANLASSVSTTFFAELLHDRPLLWQMRVGSDLFDIRISFTYKLHHEGDLQLIFLRNSVPLYYLAFTITPGWLVGCAADDVMLIARLQGIAGDFAAIRGATKTCMDVSPPALLMAALQGIGKALNIGMIAGVTNKEQLTAHMDADRRMYFDYDAFWSTYVGNAAEKFYMIRVPIPEKPLAQISTMHRRRTRLKRQFKREVAEVAEAAFRSRLKTPNEPARTRYCGADEAAEDVVAGVAAAGWVTTRALRSGIYSGPR